MPGSCTLNGMRGARTASTSRRAVSKGPDYDTPARCGSSISASTPAGSACRRYSSATPATRPPAAYLVGHLRGLRADLRHPAADKPLHREEGVLGVHHRLALGDLRSTTAGSPLSAVHSTVTLENVSGAACRTQCAVVRVCVNMHADEHDTLLPSAVLRPRFGRHLAVE